VASLRSPASRSLARTRARLVASALLGAVLALAGCATHGGSSTDVTDATPGVALADATVVSDARAYEGPSTALLTAPGLHPVAEDPQPRLPVTVTDAQGTEVTVTDVSRIIALDIYGTNARTVAELGLLGNLVGRDTSTAFPEAIDLPNVTPGGHELNAEAILALEPTVVVADTTQGPWDVILQLREAGIPVVITSSERSLDTAADDIRFLADALGVPEEGERLAERTETAIDSITEQIATVADEATGGDPLRMAFLYVRGGTGIYYLFGDGSGAGSLITALGGVDIATEVGLTGMKPVTDEGLIAMQPDVLLVMTKGLESAGGVDGLLNAVPAIAQTPAGEHRRIVDMDDATILSFGPTSADVLEALAVAIYAPGPGA